MNKERTDQVHADMANGAIKGARRRRDAADHQEHHGCQYQRHEAQEDDADPNLHAG